MSDSEDFESAMSFWLTLDNLATVDEDVAGEELEELSCEDKHDTGTAGLIRLNSEGEEMEDETALDEEYLTCLTGRVREDSLFLTGVEYEEEYFESLSGVWETKEQKCYFCQVKSLIEYMFLKKISIRIFLMKI